MPAENTEKTSQFDAWILAIRPKTLPAAASPVVIGSALAFVDGKFDFWPALTALLGSLLLQIISNVANDLFDFKRGADAGERLGPTRVTQAGLLTSDQVQRGLMILIGLTVLIGIYLVIHAGWLILVLGVVAIISAVAYTGGPFPLAYHGLGDLFVFVFFGLAATAGTYFVQVGTVSSAAWWMACSIGLLIVAILIVNNLRDIESDRAAGKRTLAVRFGVHISRLEYAFCIFGAYAIPMVTWALGLTSFWGLVVFLSIPMAWRCVRVVNIETGGALNKVLAGTGRLGLVFALLFSFGIIANTLW
ncbi:MAG: 1,4-dihydroxy-2-naphthoate polyprenyltransferase [Anaerolineales bacterium]|nr:1,4-dihydroxy-2-naphthoate polyprenyltransferase [Chloroflexota bacterium]MBL6982901.1 1,4-dihydroxy-2-naphthoate polyprenyltransferase [Anaerolineales bacterium]